MTLWGRLSTSAVGFLRLIVGSPIPRLPAEALTSAYKPQSVADILGQPCYRIPVKGRSLKLETGGAEQVGKKVSGTAGCNPLATAGEVAPIGRLACMGGGASAGTAGGTFIMKAAPVVANCNATGTITLTRVKLPDGWCCTTPFPIAVNMEKNVRY